MIISFEDFIKKYKLDDFKDKLELKSHEKIDFYNDFNDIMKGICKIFDKLTNIASLRGGQVLMSLAKLQQSEAVINNPCKKVEDKRPKLCSSQERENPSWPVGYTYLDRFIDDMRKLNNGDMVFTAMTIGDYEMMSANVQELRRYIRELGEVIVYYRNVTIKEEPTETVD